MLERDSETGLNVKALDLSPDCVAALQGRLAHSSCQPSQGSPRWPSRFPVSRYRNRHAISQRPSLIVPCSTERDYGEVVHAGH